MRPEPLMIGTDGAIANFTTTFFSGNFAAGTNVSFAIVGGKLEISSAGGSGSPGGIHGNIQFNNGGSFDGMSGTLTDGSSFINFQSLLVNFGGNSARTWFGNGDYLDLGSPAYMYCSGSSGYNVGYTANRADNGSYCSFDWLEGATGASGWSAQMAPGSSNWYLIDRISSVPVLSAFAGNGAYLQRPVQHVVDSSVTEIDIAEGDDHVIIDDADAVLLVVVPTVRKGRVIRLTFTMSAEVTVSDVDSNVVCHVNVSPVSLSDPAYIEVIATDTDWRVAVSKNCADV